MILCIAIKASFLCFRFLKTNMGSFLMRSPRDEPLLVGDLVSHLSQLYVPTYLEGFALRGSRTMELFSRRKKTNTHICPIVKQILSLSFMKGILKFWPHLYFLIFDDWVRAADLWCHWCQLCQLTPSK